VLAARAEVTDRTLIFGERHLRLIRAEYEAQLQRTTPSSQPAPAARTDHPAADLSQRRIKRRPVLDGLINEYKRAA
jgi:putative transposase